MMTERGITAVGPISIAHTASV